MKLHGVLFDLDGTLGDTIPVCIKAFQRTFQHYLGREFATQEVVDLFGPNEEGMLQRHLPQTWPQALDMYLAEYEQAHTTCKELFVGIVPLLDGLRSRGLHLGIVTGKGAGSARISAHVFGLDQYFDEIETGSADGPIKPTRIRSFLTRWNLPPQAVAYVGDHPSDIDAAHETGVVAVAAGWAASADVAALAACKPHVLFQNVADFAAWVEQASQ